MLCRLTCRRAAIRAWWRRRLAAGGRDRGAGALELVLIAPAVFLLIFGIIQAGLYFHAREAAHRAAEQGVETGRAVDATAGEGRTAAAGFLDRMGGSVSAPRVTASGGRQVRISVTGSVVTLVPGLQLPVRATAQGPKERWTP